MKKFPILTIISILLFSLLTINDAAVSGVNAQDISPTPTYDPLAEPVLPENPDELELGHFWFWHNCMACHGDVGQGLTDEFRGIWPEDHQNCWAHGCHNPNMDNEGFPIPRYVPALVRSDKLLKFSQQGLVLYLKSTHPPQDPGVLEDEQYLAIVKYLFEMNDRALEAATQMPTLVPTLAPTSVPTAAPSPPPDQVQATETRLFPSALMISLSVILVIILIWRLQTKK